MPIYGKGRGIYQSSRGAHVVIFLLIVFLVGNARATSSPTLSIDVWTNKGGAGSDTHGGSFAEGEISIIYWEVNMNVTEAKLVLYKPDETLILVQGPLNANSLYYGTGIAGTPGWRHLIFEAWTSDSQYAKDELYYLVRPTSFTYAVTVRGFGGYSVKVYLDNGYYDVLGDGQSVLFQGLTGTHKISVDNAISISNDTRIFCPVSSITVYKGGSYTFHYTKQYVLTISAEPSGGGTASLASGWYDGGSNLTITAWAASGYAFRNWTGDFRSPSSTINISFNRSMSLKAVFGKLSAISCMISTDEVERLGNVTISGQVTPSPGYPVTLAVKLTNPGGSRGSAAVTDSDGNYRLTFSPDISGHWNISVGWGGDDNFLPAESETAYLTVKPKIYAVTVDASVSSDLILVRVDGDGVKASDLPKTYHWEEFTRHNISVDAFYDEGGTKRYEFLNWSDGSVQLERTLTIDGDMELGAVFFAQYRLNVTSEFGNVNGEGWYDDGSTAEAIVDRGEVGAEDVFHIYVLTGWGGDASGTGTTSDPIIMDGPKTAVAIWERRLSAVFYVAVGGIALAALGSLFVLQRRKHRGVGPGVKAEKPSGVEPGTKSDINRLSP